jgi:hypothetical protein
MTVTRAASAGASGMVAIAVRQEAAKAILATVLIITLPSYASLVECISTGSA